jgi:hypothetical protein
MIYSSSFCQVIQPTGGRRANGIISAVAKASANGGVFIIAKKQSSSDTLFGAALLAATHES